MKKILNWVLAATLICGTSVLTSCTSDNEDNSGQEQAKKDRKEFIEHTRKNLKEVAENMNLSTWKSVNHFNMYFNQYVLLNDNFDKSLSRTFGEMIQSSMQPAPEELAKLGKKYLATINIADFNYTFVSTQTGFDVKPNDDEGMVIEIESPLEGNSVKIAIKGTGSEYRQSNERMSNDSVQVAVNFAKHYELTLSTKENGKWESHIVANSDLTIEQDGNRPEGVPANGTSIMNDAWNLKGTVVTNIPGDATAMEFNFGQDPRIHKANMTLDYIHNGKKTIGLTTELTNRSGSIGAMSMMSPSGSILGLITVAMTGKSLDNLQLTLLDDLTTTFKVSDCAKVMKLQSEMAEARRQYANQETIEGYVSQLNELISGSMSCKGLNQEFPMRLATTPIGVDWWAMPALEFGDEKGYVPLNQMLDQKSLEYCINIIDHASEPLQETGIIVRQLIWALQKMNASFMRTKPQK